MPAFTNSLDVDVGDPTKASDYDTLADNTEANRDFAHIDHDFTISTGTGYHRGVHSAGTHMIGSSKSATIWFDTSQNLRVKKSSSTTPPTPSSDSDGNIIHDGNAISLETTELTVVDGDILGRIDWSAPLESSGTDAILVSASIWAEADDTFAADNNTASLVFAASTTETAAARMRMNKTALHPHTTDTMSLGTASLNWSDLFLDSGGVINFDSGNVTVTHSTGSLAFSGAVDIAGDLTLSAGADGAIRFSAASSIKILDNSATSLVIEEADDAYLTFVTTNSGEKIILGKDLEGAAGTFTSLDVGDGNIANVGQISLDTIISDGSTVTIGTGSTLVFTDDTTIAMTLGTDAGDDFTVNSTHFVVEGDTGFVGIGAVPTASALHITHDAQCYARFTETSDGDVGYVGAANHMITGGTADYLGVRGESGIQFSGGGSGALHATITSSGDTLISNGGGLIIGHTAQISPEGTNSEFQVLGTGAADGSMVIGRYDSGNPPALYFFSSKHADIGGNLPLTTGNVLGQVVFLGDDGTDETSIGAAIAAIAADDFANNDSPTDLVFRTTVAGSNSATERMRISSDGTTTFHSTAQVKTSGSGLFNLINTNTGAGEDTTMRFQVGDSSDFLKGGFGFTRNSSTYGTGYLTWSVDANDDAANVDAAGGSADEVMTLSATQLYIKGDVGIGASPTSRLFVQDSTDGRYAVGITQNATGNGGALNINSAGTNHIVGITGTGVQAAGDHCLTVTSTGAQTNAPVVHFNANNSSTSQPALKCSYIGTGSAAHFVKGIEVQQQNLNEGLFLPLTLGSISSGNEYSKLGGGVFDTAVSDGAARTIFTANAGGLNGALILLTTRENASGDAYTALILVTDDTNEGTPSHTVVSSTNDGGSNPTVSYAWSGSNFQITNNSGTLIQMYSTVLSVHGSN